MTPRHLQFMAARRNNNLLISNKEWTLAVSWNVAKYMLSRAEASQTISLSIKEHPPSVRDSLKI